jgi:hypothetical protein
MESEDRKLWPDGWLEVQVWGKRESNTGQWCSVDDREPRCPLAV